MDRKDLKMILAGLSIAGLIAGCAAAPSKVNAGGGPAMEGEKNMEGQTGGSSCSGSKQELMNEEKQKAGASSCSGSKEMEEEKPSGGSSCSGSK